MAEQYQLANSQSHGQRKLTDEFLWSPFMGSHHYIIVVMEDFCLRSPEEYSQLKQTLNFSQWKSAICIPKMGKLLPRKLHGCSKTEKKLHRIYLFIMIVYGSLQRNVLDKAQPQAMYKINAHYTKVKNRKRKQENTSVWGGPSHIDPI